MRRIITGMVLSVLLLFLLGACSSSDEEIVIRDVVQDPTVEVIESTQVVEPAVEVVAEPEVEAPIVDERPPMKKDISKLLDKVHSASNENYHYIEINPKRGDHADSVWVNGDKMKIELFDVNERPAGWEFNTIYLDRSTRTAIGYCTKNAGECPEGRGPFDADYDEFIRKTPLEWMQDVDYLLFLSSDTVNDRPIHLVEYTEGAQTWSLSIDAFYGYPIKMVMDDGFGERTWEFMDMLVGSVTKYDVNAP